MEEVSFIQYNKSPVREAIFSLSFDSPLTADDLRTFSESDWAKQQYGIAEPEGEPNESGNPLGYIVYNGDRTALLRITLTQLRYHRLGHYPGWNTASAAFLECWEQLKNQIPTAIRQSASIRYINEIRLDIPAGGSLELGDYFNLVPNLPDKLPGSPGPFFLQVQVLNSEPDLLGIITETAELITEEPYGINIVLDIRVQDDDFSEGEKASLIEVLTASRKFKNDIFESCITDVTRELFK